LNIKESITFYLCINPIFRIQWDDMTPSDNSSYLKLNSEAQNHDQILEDGVGIGGVSDVGYQHNHYSSNEGAAGGKETSEANLGDENENEGDEEEEEEIGNEGSGEHSKSHNKCEVLWQGIVPKRIFTGNSHP
jgi:hypothetical protein